MAEVKNTAETKGKARVLAGTFPAAATDQAKKLLKGMEAAVKAAADKKINVCICK